jgi:hypothetical protein
MGNTSDLIGGALSRAVGFAAGALKGMRAVTGAARHLLSAFGTARIGQLRSMMSSFEGFWLRTKETAQGLRKLRALALTLTR